MEPRLQDLKDYPRAMKSYVLMLYEFIIEYKPAKVLEVGVQNGQSTKTMLLGMIKNGLGQLVSIDHKDRSGILDVNFPDAKPFWHFIQGNSHTIESLEAANNMLEDGEFYDMFFIDGDHSYDGVKQDWEMYTPLVKPGGIIMLHDIVNENEGVKDFWPEIGWEKFAIDWGASRRSSITPGFGLVKKPYEG